MDGYIGAAELEKRMAANTWDVTEIAYNIFGLVSPYQYFNLQNSLEASIKLAEYLMPRLPESLAQHMQKGTFSADMFTCGLDRAMIALYKATGDKRFLDFCIDTLKLLEWSQEIVLGRHGLILGHAYTFLNRCIAQLELYKILGDERLLSQSKRVMNFLQKEGGLLIPGYCGKSECWYSDQSGDGEVAETCATAYLIFFLDTLFRLEGNVLYADIMERTIYNALFGAQSSDGRQIRYYTSFEGKRIYWPRDNYCCPSNFRRAIAKLPELIYYTSQGGLVVNMYTSSCLKTEIGQGLSLDIVQETDYPSSGTVTIHVHPSRKEYFPISLRIPSWCKNFTLRVNNKPVSVFGRDGFVVLKQEWKPGDTIVLDMDMGWRLVKGFNIQQGRVAIMRGPVLFCLNSNRNRCLSGHNIAKIVIDPSTLKLPERDDTIRSNEVICCVKAYSSSDFIERGPGLDLVLTEFPDPEGEKTYFFSSDMSNVRDDELLIGKQ